jgi:hypothetical protein
MVIDKPCQMYQFLCSRRDSRIVLRQGRIHRVIIVLLHFIHHAITSRCHQVDRSINIWNGGRSSNTAGGLHGRCGGDQWLERNRPTASPLSSSVKHQALIGSKNLSEYTLARTAFYGFPLHMAGSFARAFRPGSYPIPHTIQSRSCSVRVRDIQAEDHKFRVMTMFVMLRHRPNATSFSRSTSHPSTTPWPICSSQHIAFRMMVCTTGRLVAPSSANSRFPLP